MLSEANIVIKVLFLCFAGFLAQFVDAIAGGGGVISVPAYFMIGFPAHMTLGTNKFSGSSGSIASAYRYYKSGKMDLDLLKYMLPFSLIGSICGAYLVMLMDPDMLKPIILVLLLGVGVYSFFSKNVGFVDNYVKATKKQISLGVLLAFIMGMYDGFFGPGTGSFIIFGLIKIFGFDYVRAGGNAKAMNFASNIAALFMFIIGGKISYLMGIPMAIFSVLGANLGAKVAIKNGAKIIRPIFVTMSLAISIKMLYELVIL